MRLSLLLIIALGAYSSAAEAAHYLLNPQTKEGWRDNEIWVRIDPGAGRIIETMPGARVTRGVFQVDTLANFHCDSGEKLRRMLISAPDTGAKIDRQPERRDRHVRGVRYNGFPITGTAKLIRDIKSGQNSSAVKVRLEGYCDATMVLGGAPYVERYVTDITLRILLISAAASEQSNGGVGRRENLAPVAHPRCKPGYVWREAGSRDFICVTPDIRTMAYQENQMARSRVEPGGGAYGSQTCKQGFVWREAFPGDKVCVTPESRDQARRDNQAHSSRVARQ